MLKKLLVVGLLCTLGGAGIVTSKELEIAKVKAEFFASTEYTVEEKSYIWSEAWNVVEEDLSNLTFGGGN